MKTILALAALLAGTTFTYAQSSTTGETTTSGAGSFYIVQDASTKRCTVTRERPTTKTMTIVGSDGAVYKTEQQARSALKTTKVCVTDQIIRWGVASASPHALTTRRSQRPTCEAPVQIKIKSLRRGVQAAMPTNVMVPTEEGLSTVITRSPPSETQEIWSSQLTLLSISILSLLLSDERK